MSIGLSTAVLVVTLVVTLGSGLYVALALASVGIIGFEVLADAGRQVSAIMYNSMNSYTLAAIPMYIFMGNLVLYSGLSERLYRGVSQLTRILPGGLTQSNIASCAIFAAVSGSSVATAATIGTVAFPEQKARGYDTSLVTGSLAAGGTLGILIPPSLTMIIYGSFVGVSVGRLFIGGVIPGVTLAAMFMLFILIRSIINPSLAPERARISPRYFLDAVKAIRDVWPILVIILSILGSIYTGVATPTEAASLSAILAMVLAAMHRKLSYGVVKESAVRALRTSAMILFLMMGAHILGGAVSVLRIPDTLAEIILSAGIDRMLVWLGVIFLYLLLGCFMDCPPMMLLSLPVTFPILIGIYGFDPVWFGVMLVILCECCLLTPPVGLNLFVIQGVTGGVDLWIIIKGAMPFFFIMLCAIAFYTFFPELVLLLPNMMVG